MSESKRLEFITNSFCDMGCDCGLMPEPIECKDGRFVFYSDYAILEAEIAQLHRQLETFDRESMSDEYDLNNQNRIINGLLTDKEQMQAKIDRLIKAGNLLAFHYVSLGRKFFPDDPLPSSFADWNAAKEGKQS